MLLLLLACRGDVDPPVLEHEDLAAEGEHLIPPNDPHREGHSGGFVPNPGWYGEPGWDEVRMRVAGHLSTSGRDRARLAARGGDAERAAELYEQLHEKLEAIEVEGGVAEEVLELLCDAAERDARRMRGEDIPRKPVPQVDLAAFDDFDDRHRLRVELWQGYLLSLDPGDFSEPWGYWPTDIGASDTFTREGIGALPTGDSLIDTAGEPGPKAIGSLQVLGLDDPAHQDWLARSVESLNATDTDALPKRIQQLTAELQEQPWGSTYYNIKQLRNEGVRVLARRGRYDLALEVLRTNFPLHDHDWACPNREGILLGIEGRLMALAGEGEADARLAEAVAKAEEFLERINAAGTPSAVHSPGPAPPGGPAPKRAPPPR